MKKYRTAKKVAKVLYFTHPGRSPTKPICTIICTGVFVFDKITCAMFQIEIFRGYGLTAKEFIGLVLFRLALHIAVYP